MGNDPRFDAILFDLDGTIIESGAGVTNSVRYALVKMGRPVPSYEVLKTFVGPPLTESFMRECAMTAEEAEYAVECYREYYQDRGIRENKVYAGVPEMLTALKARGETLMIATSKPEPFARQILSDLSLLSYFDFVGGASFDAGRREKEDVIAYLLGETGADPTRSVMVGDRLYDVKGAAFFGIPTVGAVWGYGSAEELTGSGAKWLAHTPAQVSEVLYG